MEHEITKQTRYASRSVSFPCKRLPLRCEIDFRIENNAHWILDLAFRDDELRVRQGHANENLAVLRHLSPNLLRHEHSSRVGIHTKRLKAGWDTAYLQRVLAGVK
jgi:hypothetical protein